MNEAPEDLSVTEFRRLCLAHDLSYHYADDGMVFERGDQQYKAICKLAATIGMPIATKIWNEVVDTKIREGSREMFYWDVPTTFEGAEGA